MSEEIYFDARFLIQLRLKLFLHMYLIHGSQQVYRRPQNGVMKLFTQHLLSYLF